MAEVLSQDEIDQLLTAISVDEPEDKDEKKRTPIDNKLLSQELPLLNHLGKIMDLSKENGLDMEFFENAKSHLEFVANELHINIIQAALFAKIIEISISKNWCYGNALFDSLKCTKHDSLIYMNYIDELVELGYLIKKMENEFPRYLVPKDIHLNMRKGNPIKLASYKNISIEKFFSRTDYLFESCCKDEMAAEETIDKVNVLINDNTQLDFVKKILSCNFNDDDRSLFILFFSQFLDNGGTYDSSNDLSLDIFPSRRGGGTVSINNVEKLFPHKHSIISQLKNQTHILQKLEYIENYNDDGFAIRERFQLTDKAKDEFLSELRHRTLNKKDFILAKEIKEKPMYYNTSEDESIKRLENLLLPENLANVKNRLSDRGLRTGFTCLFSGFPGTGKTETVYQLARKTGHDIMSIDASQIRSMWVGESEKHIKSVFDRYREHIKNSDNIPILLFNEADAIINRRTHLKDENKAVDKMENTIQSIILEEFEKLDGILLATTNLTQNMDKAFERRFLYKIEFTKPEKNIRKEIWKSMLPELTDEETIDLASRFDFSGGQIENVVRKRTIDFVLYGYKHDLSRLISYCDEENTGKTTKQIGFGKK